MSRGGGGTPDPIAGYNSVATVVREREREGDGAREHTATVRERRRRTARVGGEVVVLSVRREGKTRFAKERLVSSLASGVPAEGLSVIGCRSRGVRFTRAVRREIRAARKLVRFDVKRR